MPVQFTAVIELSSLDGRIGFKLNGIAAYDFSGISVSPAGDINHDGVADLIIGATGASPNGPGSGQSYVVFGGSGIGSGGMLELSSLTGSNGFTLNGIAAGDRIGLSVSTAGDINNDGVADLIIGATGASPNGPGSGQSYVVFGGSGIGSGGMLELSSLTGSNGFTLNGIGGGDNSGESVSTAGDINNDGVADLIIGAPEASPNGGSSGQSYVVFGASGIGSGGTLELSSLDGSNGFKLNGIAAGDRIGLSVSTAGDINNDGVADLIIGATGASSGQSYVVFGASGIGSGGTLELSSLDGSNGFKLNGSGGSVSGAGDINHDGVADLIIGAASASPNGSSSGQSYVIFGGSGIGSGGTLELSSLNGSNGFTLNGIAAGDLSGSSVSTAGDINNDGVFDLMIGAYRASPNGSYSGQSYVIFGGQLALDTNKLSISQGQRVILTKSNLSASSIDHPDATLEFQISNIEHGHFEDHTVPGTAITRFIQQKIFDQNILFLQDGTPNVPSYSVTVSDGTNFSPKSLATITFNYAPVLETNNLSIGRGKTVLITPNNLRATDRETPANDLIFSISALRNGQFEFISNPGFPISEFSQDKVALVEVQFIHDGSDNAPHYNVSISDNLMTTTSSAALINWDPALQIPFRKDHTARNTLIGTFLSVGVVGTLLLCYISMGFLQKRRLKAVGQRANEEQAHFYKTVIIPIAQAVFKQIKVTGFMNYISANQMEAYVAEIAVIMNEINQLGIHIELQEMKPDHQTQLLNQIVKQMKRHLGIQMGVCNRAWFASFFKAQVRPEMIGAKAKLIASSVHAALMGNPDEDFDEVEMSNVRLLAGDERRDSANNQDILHNKDIEIARLQHLLAEHEENAKKRDTENERLRELLNQQATDDSFNSTTSYLQLE